MMATSMLRQKVWMTGDDEFDHILENSQRVLKLNAQYENHPYVEEFTKGCSVMFIYGTYILEEGADAKFSLSEIWNLLQADSLPNNISNLFRQLINYEGMDKHTKNIRFYREHLDYQANTQDNDAQGKASRWKRCLRYRNSLAFAGHHNFALADLIGRYMEDAIFRFHETKKDDPIMATTNLF